MEKIRKIDFENIEVITEIKEIINKEQLTIQKKNLQDMIYKIDILLKEFE